MAEFPALPLWTDALIGDTYHLTPAQFGAYMRLLIAAWRLPDCSLPNDDAVLGRYVGDTHNWHRLKHKVLPFFSIGSDGRLRQKKLTNQLTFLRQRKARSSAGGKAKALKTQQQRSAKRLLNERQKPASTPTPKEERKKEESKKEAINGNGFGGKRKPRHRQTSKEGRIWLDAGTDDFVSYAADYWEKHHAPVPLLWHDSGAWFNFQGES